MTKRAPQSGFTLIEGLVSILIFSIGILALVGLQSTSISQSTQAQYRSEAAMLANELIGQMWAGENMPATTADPLIFRQLLPVQYSQGSAAVTAWSARVSNALPTPAANPPTVVIDGNGLVTINIWWLAPNEGNVPPHNFVMVTQISR